jgi:hypothetical protein
MQLTNKMAGQLEHAFLVHPNQIVQVADKQYACSFGYLGLQMGSRTPACIDTMLFGVQTYPNTQQ